MLVVIKSAPHTEDAQAGLRLAREMSANLMLLQNGVYLARQGGLEGINGAVYALENDIRLRGAGAQDERAKTISYNKLVDIMAEDKVIGMF